jgi:hypothetical protein
MEREQGNDLGTFAVHGAEIVGVHRTVDCRGTHDAVITLHDGTLVVSGEEAKLAKRLDDWRRAGLLSDELFRQRITSAADINRAHRRTHVSRQALSRDTAVRDHEHEVVDHDHPITTLHDINVRNRRRCA